MVLKQKTLFMVDNDEEQMSSDETQSKDAESKKASIKKKVVKKKTPPKKGKASSKKKNSRAKKSTVKKQVPNAQRPYPVNELEDALKLPQSIREHNNGHPWDPELAARATLGLAKSNNKFFYLAASSRDYNLTVGSRDTEKISLSDLGRRVVFAGSEDEKKQGLVEAFFSVDIFKRVHEHYGGSNLPKDEFLRNVLQNDFGLDPAFHQEFVKIFKANCAFLGIEAGLKPGITVSPSTDVDSSEVRLVGEPRGKFDRTAFVIMPFSEKGDNPRPQGFFLEVLNTLITPAANSAGFAVETADQQGSDIIQSTIINQLLQKDLVIADLSDHNPNVLFELGIRIAKSLPVALIKATGTRPIFDVDNMMRVVSYSPNLWPTTVQIDIPKLRDHIKAAWDNRDSVRPYMEILTGHVKPPAKIDF